MGVFNGYEFARLSEFWHVIFYMRLNKAVSLKFEESLFKIQYLYHLGSPPGPLCCVPELSKGMFKASIAAKSFLLLMLFLCPFFPEISIQKKTQIKKRV